MACRRKPVLPLAAGIAAERYGEHVQARSSMTQPRWIPKRAVFMSITPIQRIAVRLKMGRALR
jgi:hypothetical protein